MKWLYARIGAIVAAVVATIALVAKVFYTGKKAGETRAEAKAKAQVIENIKETSAAAADVVDNTDGVRDELYEKYDRD